MANEYDVVDLLIEDAQMLLFNGIDSGKNVHDALVATLIEYEELLSAASVLLRERLRNIAYSQGLDKA